MNIAMTVWGDRVSPVLDSRGHYWSPRLSGAEILSRKHEPFDADYLAR